MTVALVSLSACFSNASAPKTTSTTAPARPDVVALVSLIGTGPLLGSGTSLEGIDLTASSAVAARTIGVGTFPDAVAVSPSGKTAYVVNYTSNTVTPVDLRTGKVLRAITVGSGPAGIAITPDGKTAYVTDAGTTPLGDTVTPINLTTDRPLAPITVGPGPQGIVITPDGTTAYVANAGAIVTGQSGAIGNTVTPIDLRSGVAGKPITVGNAPLALAVSSDGSSLYVANSGSGSVTPVTLATGAVGAAIPVTGAPQAIAISGSTAWVADASSGIANGNNLTPISLSNDTAGSPVRVGKGLTAVAITPDGTTAWVVSSGTNSIIPVDLATAVARTADAVPTGSGPYALALVTEPRTVAVAAFGPVKVPKAKKTAASPTT